MVLLLLQHILLAEFCTAQLFPAADALRSAGYTVITDLLQVTSTVSQLPRQFTLFAPLDTAFAFLMADPARADLLRYHVATQRLVFDNLTSLPLGARIETMLPDHTILVTSLEGELLRAGHLSLDGVQIVEPDLFVNEEIAVHGIAEVMNPYIFGVDLRINSTQSVPEARLPLINLTDVIPPLVTLPEPGQLTPNVGFALSQAGLLKSQKVQDRLEGNPSPRLKGAHHLESTSELVSEPAIKQDLSPHDHEKQLLEKLIYDSLAATDKENL
ncbi:hypothetical protein O6H91_12G026700 [Diphasiastrum complanatum]|nr:hypothetical protein O6H91_12G026700 [Diphasiastrum complanatum]